MKVNRNILLFFLLICILIGIASIPTDYIYRYLKPILSKDGLIMPESILKLHRIVIFAKTFLIFLLVIVFAYLKFNVIINEYLNKILYSTDNKLSKVQISFNHFFYLFLVFSVLLMFYALFYFDIGVDESAYLNDIQNIAKYGLPTSADNYKEMSYLVYNLPLNLVSLLVVKLFNFNVYYIRAIILLTSFGVLCMLYLLIDDKDRRMIAIVMILAFPGINYLTSGCYLEMMALFFILAALWFIKKANSHSNANLKTNLSALMMALAIASKFQIFLLFGLVAVFLFIFFEEKYFYFKYTLRVFLIYGLITIVSLWFSGIGNFLKLVSARIGDSGAAFLPSIAGFLNKTFWLSEMIFMPLLFLTWFETSKGIHKAPLFHKLLFAFSIVCVFHWWIFYGATTWRNAFIGLAATIILFAVRYPFSIKSTSFKAGIIAYALFGLVINYAFIRNGSIDDVQYYRSHVLKSVFTYDNPNYQKEFFKEIRGLLHSEDKVYSLGWIFIPKIYLDNREILSFEELSKPSDLPLNAYVIITYEMLMSGIDKTDNYKWITQQCLLIYQSGDYYLYKR